ncbi:tripartite tricarboxylate transporter permease [Chloroflexota bacterium]
MLDMLGGAVGYLLHYDVYLIIFLGCVIGLVFGALPGLGGATAIALLLPVTYSWDSMLAFFFFAGIMGSTAFGGSIPAILLNTPGTAPNAATCFDGYPMAQRGEAGKALGISATASGVGALFGLVVLILLIPLVYPIVLAFRPPEFFVLVLFGLATVAFAARGNFLRGLISGGLGILLSFVGYSTIFGRLRFNFGSEFLWDGIELIPFLIGVFALSEMLRLSVKGGVITGERITGKLSGTMDGFREVFRHKVTLLRSSLIGTGIGIVPGVGGAVANFLAYIATVQASKHPETFGTGDPEGVIASEASNDAKDGGALLPTVAFGIPGSAVMALLLGAFILHGLTPGPLFMTENIDIIFALIVGLVISNVLASTFGLAVGKYLAWITTIRVSYIVPVVVVLCLTGSFFLRGNIWDVGIAMLGAILGYAMQRFGFSTVCLIIGLILGRIAESSFRQTLMISDGSYAIWFTRPISLVLIFLLVVVSLFPVLTTIRTRRRSKG